MWTRRSGHICLLAETGKQSYFKQFSHLHSCVHPRWIQDHKSSWTIPLYLCKWHCPYCSCGYTHQCLQWNLLNDMCHQYCRGRMKKFTFIKKNNEKNIFIWKKNMKKKNWSKRQKRLLIKFNRQYLCIQWNKKSKVLSGSSNATSTKTFRVLLLS